MVVLDFIGNYNNDYMIPIALSGDRTGNKDNIRRAVMDGGEIKGVSTIHFDAIAKQRIYKSIDSAKLNGKRLLREEYHRLKCKIGRVPDLMDYDEHGELDPLRIMDTYGSYYNFLKDVEKEDYNVDLDEVMEQMLFFVSTKLASGKRPHELLLLKLLIHNCILNHSRGALGEMTDDEISDVALIRTKGSVVEAWKSVMLKKYSIQVDELCELNVRNVLTNVFFAIGSAANTFDKCVFLTKEGNISKNFEKALKNQDFRSLLLSVVSFGLYRNTRDYSNRNKGSQFVINQKYTYDEVCRLLNWEKNQVATNIGGYKYDPKTKTYPVFVNYHKEEGISDTTKYEDRFIGPSELLAISKSKRKIKSPDVQTALNSVELGVRMDLFVRKNKDDKESKEFYYLGAIYPTGKVEEFQMPNTEASAVRIYYNLETPVKPSLYEFITEEVI